MSNRLIIGIIIISVFLGAATLTRGHDWGDDFASYIMQAGSILNNSTRDFVERNSFTIFESSNQIGPVAYPWGYPVILTPVYAIKGIHPLALKLPGLLFYAGFLICLYLLMKKRLTQTESLVLVSLFAFNPLLLQFLDQILSDIPFLFFSTLGLLLLSDQNKDNDIHSAVIGIIIFFAFFFRTTGILLLASFVAFEILTIPGHYANRDQTRRRWRNVLITCLTFGFLFLINLWLFPGGEMSHLALYQKFEVETALGFTRAYFQVFDLFFGEALAWKIIYYIVFAFFLLGMWIKRNEELLFIVFFSFWMILLITWPAWQGPRFIFPLLPVFIYFAFQGMKFVVGKLPGAYTWTGQWLFYGFWLSIIGVFLLHSGANAYINLQNERGINGPFDPYSREVYSYIKEKTAPDSVIVFFKPRVMAMMTEHPSLMSTECDRMLKGEYIVLSRKVGENQQIPPEEIDACNLPLNQVLKNNRFIVYEIQK